jgi:hypothetical protein
MVTAGAVDASESSLTIRRARWGYIIAALLIEVVALLAVVLSSPPSPGA